MKCICCGSFLHQNLIQKHVIYRFQSFHDSTLPTLCNLVLQGSRDNMSIVIVAFEGAPKVSDEAKEKEAELDSRLELKVKGDSRRESFCPGPCRAQKIHIKTSPVQSVLLHF